MSSQAARTPRRLGALPFLAFLLVFGVGAYPGFTQQAPAPLRIAVVDLDRVFLLSPLGVKLREELKQLEATTRAELEKRAKAMDDLQRSMEGKTPEEQRVIARRREDEELALRRVRDDAQRQAAKLESDRRREIETQLQPVFNKLQEEQNFDLILNKSTGLVIFVKDSIDITAMVLERVGAPAPAG